MLNRSGLLGTISEGAYADLLVLNANPLEDVTVLDRPEDHLLAVMKQGRVMSCSQPQGKGLFQSLKIGYCTAR